MLSIRFFLSIQLVILLSTSLVAAAAERVLWGVDTQLQSARIETRDVVLEPVSVAGGRRAEVAAGHSIEWPGFTLWAPDGHWDLRAYRMLSVQITNRGQQHLEVGLRVDAPGADGDENKRITAIRDLAPGESQTLSAALYQTAWALGDSLNLLGMRAAPGQAAIDLAHVEKLLIFVVQPRYDHRFLVSDITAHGALREMAARDFLPFIDRYGQFVHLDWQGKIESDKDLQAHRATEAKDLAAHPVASARSRYGGWVAGPRFEASGFFRTHKYRDRWWLVDPDGYLFWSHGIDCVASEFGATGTSGREAYFAGLPAADGELGQFYGTSTWAPHGYYKDKTPFVTYNHRRANLWRKYGPNWSEAFADLTHRRLASWGVNTVANWSDAEIYSQRRTPYVGSVWVETKAMEGSQGYWGKFHDVFDPGFRAAVRRALVAKKQEALDPWCMGFFVDNELAWGDETALAIAALASPPSQAAKEIFIEDLRARYEHIDELNARWGTSHLSWDALAEDRAAPVDIEGAREDLVAFSTRIARTYFRTVREELKALNPQQLYLGARFAWQNEHAVRAAAEFCDVLSFNWYQYSAAGLHVPAGVDKPVLIGEFHFGATDRGMFHPGLRPAENQAHRGALYKDYMRSALAHPLIVGAHWFQYGDQSTAGRGDGENFNIGFVDITDTPYPALVEAARQIGAEMYELRAAPPTDAVD